ncbi:MAG: hypothetical protein HY017_21385 [Betaproteobacteria bacterium]|nr:hypothetical protein [Betaproteobacteria bacterium]
MKNAYAELEALWNRCTATGDRQVEAEVVDLLEGHGIRLRQRDGQLKQITLSTPTSVNSGFVIGLRYVKQDGSHTEDLFTVQPGQQIQPFYKGSLQKQWPEYQGTHERQVIFALVDNEPAPTTAVNTISQIKK